MRRIWRRIGIGERLHNLFFGGIWRRIGWILAAGFFGAGTTIWLRADVFGWVLAPAGGQLSPFDGKPIYNVPGGMLMALIKTAIKAGVVTSIPMIWIQSMSLLRPWMPRRFWWWMLGFSVASAASTLTGLAFIYYVMLPIGLSFLLNFDSDIAEPVILITAYIGLFTSMMLSGAAVFNIPLLMYGSVRSGVMSYWRYKLLRKFYWPTALFFGTLLSPGGDLFSAVILSGSLILLYEAGMFISWLADPTQGDYLFIKAIWGAIFWVVSRPFVAYRKVERFLVRHGLAWWW